MQQSIGDVLSANHILWKYYGGGFNASGMSLLVYLSGRYWRNGASPFCRSMGKPGTDSEIPVLIAAEAEYSKLKNSLQQAS